MLTNLFHPLSHLALCYGNTTFNSPNKEFFHSEGFFIRKREAKYLFRRIIKIICALPRLLGSDATHNFNNPASQNFSF